MKLITNNLLGKVSLISVGLFMAIQLLLAVWSLLPLGFNLAGLLKLFINTITAMKRAGFDAMRSVAVPLLTVILGVGLGVCLLVEHQTTTWIALTATSAGGLGGIWLYPPFHYGRLMDRYKRHERYLIQP